MAHLSVHIAASLLVLGALGSTCLRALPASEAQALYRATASGCGF